MAVKKTYHFEVTNSKGEQVATHSIDSDGKPGSRDRANTQAQMWKVRQNFKGRTKMTIRTTYDY